MNISGKKKNGDYLVKILTGVEGLQKDSGYQKENLARIESDFKEHKVAEYKRRDLDRDWQKAIDLTLAKAIECPKSTQIDEIQDDVKELKTDKTLNKGKFLGMNRIWIIVIAVFMVTMFVLNVLWKFRML